jgi:hypothetical protein
MGEWERKRRWGGRIEHTVIVQDADGGGAVDMEATTMGPGCRISEGWRRQTGHKETTSMRIFSLGHGEADAAATKHGRRGLGCLLADRRRRAEVRRGGEEEE